MRLLPQGQKPKLYLYADCYHLDESVDIDTQYIESKAQHFT